MTHLLSRGSELEEEVPIGADEVIKACDQLKQLWKDLSNASSQRYVIVIMQFVTTIVATNDYFVFLTDGRN